MNQLIWNLDGVITSRVSATLPSLVKIVLAVAPPRGGEINGSRAFLLLLILKTYQFIMSLMAWVARMKQPIYFYWARIPVPSRYLDVLAQSALSPPSRGHLSPASQPRVTEVPTAPVGSMCERSRCRPGWVCEGFNSVYVTCITQDQAHGFLLTLCVQSHRLSAKASIRLTGRRDVPYRLTLETQPYAQWKLLPQLLDLVAAAQPVNWNVYIA